MGNFENCFDTPVIYKGVEINCATLADDYYSIKSASESLIVNQLKDKDIDLLQLPYLTYIFKKGEQDENFKILLDMMKYIVSVSFRKYATIILEDSLLIYEPTKEHDQYKNEYLSIIEEMQLGLEQGKETRDLLELREKVLALEKKIYKEYRFNCADFDNIRYIICELNGIDTTVYDPRWEKKLIEARKLKNENYHSEENLTISDLVKNLAFYLKRLPQELKNMSILTFDHYIKLMQDFEEYKLNRSAELQGTEFKQKIIHWIRHYKPQGKYDDVLSKNSAAFDSVE
ncbi:MAG: hypothetical protein WCO84_01530 [bacterium]